MITLKVTEKQAFTLSLFSLSLSLSLSLGNTVLKKPQGGSN